MTDFLPTEDSALARALAQPFTLGLFLPLQSGGWSPSTLPRSTTWTFPYTQDIALRAEALGFDLLFGLGKWLGPGGYGGQTNYHGISLDPFMATAALTAVTSRILLVSTMHILYGPLHPLHLARFGASLDHISGGRWGVNIVTGHRESEHRRFGKPPIPHGDRYAMAAEFLDFATAIWQSDTGVSGQGRFWTLEDAYEAVKPRFGRPPIVIASGSDDGIALAAQHGDILFTSSPAGEKLDAALQALPPIVAKLNAAAAAKGRQVKTMVNPIVICRPTEREALAYRDAIMEHADWGAISAFETQKSDAHAWKNFSNAHRAVGSNVLHIVGSPEHVAEQLAALAAIGIGGAQISFFDYQPDLEQFGLEVLPLLQQAGLRLPNTAAPAPLRTA